MLAVCGFSKVQGLVLAELGLAPAAGPLEALRLFRVRA
jgi:hypothetical protein